MTQKRASSDALDGLHALVAEALIEQITAFKEHRLVEYSRVYDAESDGEQQYIKVFPPALLAQAIKFLSENGIDMPAQSGNRVDTLKKAMPDFDEMERGNVVSIRK